MCPHPPHKAKKERLDLRLLSLGLASSRSQAQGLIMSGQVQVNGSVATKAGLLVHPDRDQILCKSGCPFVSRGGLKLQKALDVWQLETEGIRFIDAGASTGGFTDCLLQAGAAQGLAVDVGYGQLAWPLRQSPKVVVLERSNIKHLEKARLPFSASHAVSDCSFIALGKYFPHLLSVLSPSPGSWAVCLLKPQFEAKDVLSPEAFKHFDGVIRDPEQRELIRETVHARLSEAIPDWVCQEIIESPITGPAGNSEYLMLWTPHQTEALT